jgi:hypothetical protein
MTNGREKRLRPVLAEWERANFAAGGDLLSPDLSLFAHIPDGDVVATGFEGIAAFLGDFFKQWRGYRISAERLEPLDEADLLLVGKQHGTGVSSGLEIDEDLFIVFRFEGERVAAMFWHPDREGALRAAGLDS